MLILLIAGLAAAAPSPRLAPGDPMPVLRGESLSGKKTSLPDVARGRIALVTLGFSYGSRFAVEAWTGRFQRDFGTERSVTFFEVPMIGGMARMARPFIDGGMRRGTPRALHENVITVYGSGDAWKRRLGYSGPDDAYLLLLDRDGRVVWRYAGPFRDADYGALAATVRALLGHAPASTPAP
jgi:hypothetical protein